MLLLKIKGERNRVECFILIALRFPLASRKTFTQISCPGRLSYSIVIFGHRISSQFYDIYLKHNFKYSKSEIIMKHPHWNFMDNNQLYWIFIVSIKKNQV